MRQIKAGKLLLLVLLFSFFSTLGARCLLEAGRQNTLTARTVSSPSYRQDFYSPEMRREQDLLSEECRTFLRQVSEDSVYFPVPASSLDSSLTVSYVDSWMYERSYREKSRHEGTDIMAVRNERGLYPIVSISDGTITNLGWLELGGWRIGITSPQGVYYYYAHLDSYADIAEGDTVKAGQLLGFMGDSGYGPEWTKGEFDVHLHLGIYSWGTGEEISVNPYYLLRSLEDRRLKYQYS